MIGWGSKGRSLSVAYLCGDCERWRSKGGRVEMHAETGEIGWRSKGRSRLAFVATVSFPNFTIALLMPVMRTCERACEGVNGCVP